MDCLFCKIVSGELKSDIITQTNDYIVFKDINPKASTHLLVVPKIHVESLATLNASHGKLITSIMLDLPKIAKEQGLNNGFRTIVNTGAGGGQEIFHLHFHILGGSKLPGF